MFIGQYDEMNFARGRDKKPRKRRSDAGRKRAKRVGQAAAALGGVAALGLAAKNRKAIGSVGRAGLRKASQVKTAASTRLGNARTQAANQLDSAAKRAGSRSKNTMMGTRQTRATQGVSKGLSSAANRVRPKTAAGTGRRRNRRYKGTNLK